MLWRSTAITGYAVNASDGLIGTISDFLFDDSTWSLRRCVGPSSIRELGCPDAGFCCRRRFSVVRFPICTNFRSSCQGKR